MSGRRGRPRKPRPGPPAWIPDAIVVVRCKDEAASRRLLDALIPAIGAFEDPVIRRIVHCDENVSDAELEKAGAAALELEKAQP